MDKKRQPGKQLLEVLHGLDFARRWYALSSTAYPDLPRDDLPTEELAAALESTGREFRYDRRERFFATRDKGAPGQLGLNLSLRHLVAEFILVVETPWGHVGGPFSLLMRQVERSFGPALPPTPIYPHPTYRDTAGLRTVLAEGLALYDQMAAGVLATGLVGRRPEADPSAAPDRRGT